MASQGRPPATALKRPAAAPLRVSRAWVPLLALLLAAGCFGSDRTFPDETDQVVRLHVNAYAETDPDPPTDVVVEVSGLGADGEERAFEADLTFLLERQDYDEPEPRYAKVGEWSRHVDAPDFASPTVAYFDFRIPEADVPSGGTYRVSVTAKLASGKEVGASALFHHPKDNPGAP